MTLRNASLGRMARRFLCSGQSRCLTSCSSQAILRTQSHVPLAPPSSTAFSLARPSSLQRGMASMQDGVNHRRWEGVVEVAPGVRFPLVFRTKRDANGSEASFMDSPSQRTYGIPAQMSQHGDNVIFSIAGVGRFEGTVGEEGTIIGAWLQGGASYPLQLCAAEESAEQEPLYRAQYPTDPLPYPAHEVMIPGAAEEVTLSGTLTLPDGGHRGTAVLLAGSGPQLRDQIVGGHHSFRVLSDHLTRQGIAVLRYDKRGVGDSSGDYASATIVNFAADAAAAARYLLGGADGHLQNANAPFGFIGHSEGALTAPLATLELESRVDYVCLLASMAMKGIDLQERQNAAISLAAGVPAGFHELMAKQLNRPVTELIAKDGSDKEDVKRQINVLAHSFAQNLPDAFSEMFSSEQAEAFANGMNEIMTPWFVHFFNYDPLPALEKIRQLQPQLPVLAVHGEKDLQVLPENLTIISDVFKGSESFFAKEIPDLNHLFQTCEIGLHTEYSDIEETFSPTAMSVISDWVLERRKRSS